MTKVISQAEKRSRRWLQTVMLKWCGDRKRERSSREQMACSMHLRWSRLKHQKEVDLVWSVWTVIAVSWEQVLTSPTTKITKSLETCFCEG